MESIRGTDKEELLHKQYQKDRFQLINQLGNSFRINTTKKLSLNLKF